MKTEGAGLKMALQRFLCGLTVAIVLSSRGCRSQVSECGLAVKNIRVVGGQDAAPGSWPWQASLVNDFGPYCGGSLINNQWVLTAAHCISEIPGTLPTIYLGRHSQMGPNVNEVSLGVANFWIHPLYDFLTSENDISLLKLSAPVTFTDYIQPVCLASADSYFSTGIESWVTGWGDTQRNASSSLSNILQETDVPIVGNNECQCYHWFPITENMICAGFKAGGKDSCQGDSGGPLVTKSGKRWVQSGVVSFGEGCARPKSPGIYTRVSQYQDWIQNITGSNKPGFITFLSDGADSDLNFNCPTTSPTTTGVDEGGDSVFDGGDNVTRLSNSVPLSLGLVLSLYALAGNA